MQKKSRANYFYILLVAVLVLLTMTFAACDTTYDIETIELTSTPAFVTNGIELGDNLDFSGVGLKVTYSNGVTEYLDVAKDATISGFHKDIVGQQTVTVTYGNGVVEKQFSFPVDVYRPKVKSVSVDTAGVKTAYIRGQNLDLSSAIAIVTYDKLRGNDYITETFTLSSDNMVNQEGKDYKFNPELIGTQNLRFLLYGEVYASYQVTVTEQSVVGISLATNAPDKTEYAVGADIDLTGLQIRVYMNDATTSSVFSVVSDEHGGWTLDGYHGTITAKDGDGNPFDSSVTGTAVMYVYYTEGVSYTELRAANTLSLNVVVKDVKAGGAFTASIPRQTQNNVDGLDFGTVGLNVLFNDQTSRVCSLDVIYDAVSDSYKGEGFYIDGYDITTHGTQNVNFYFYKETVAGDGSISYTAELYPTYYTFAIVTVPEQVSSISIEDNTQKGIAYTRYLDTDNFSFNGYVGDIIPLADYDYTLVYNSGKTEGAVISDFSVRTTGGVLVPIEGVGGAHYKLNASGTTNLVISYNNETVRKVIAVASDTPVFDKDNASRLVFTPPTTREYNAAAAIEYDYTGAKAEIYLQDSASGEAVTKITLNGDEITPYLTIPENPTGGTATITFTYQGAVRTYDITLLGSVSNLTVVSDNRSVTSFVAENEFDRSALSGLTMSYTTESGEVTATDFTDTAWTFSIDGTPISTYPLEDGLFVSTYNVSIGYRGATASTTIPITVHNYVTSIAWASALYVFNVKQGVAITLSDYSVIVTKENGATQSILLSDAVFSNDYNRNIVTTGARAVTISVNTLYTGGSVVNIVQDWNVVAKQHSHYELRVKSGFTLPVLTKNTLLDKAWFELLEHFDNGSADSLDLSFSSYDTSAITGGSVGHYDVLVLASGERVDLFGYSDGNNFLEKGKDAQDKDILKLTVVFDTVSSASFSAGSGGTQTLKEGLEISDENSLLLTTAPTLTGYTTLQNQLQAVLDEINGWSVEVVYQSNPGSSVPIAVSGNFYVDGYNKNQIGNQTVRLINTADESIFVEFVISLTAKVMEGISVEGSLTQLTEGMPLSNALFASAYISVAYDNASTEEVPIVINSSAIAITGYNISARMAAGSGSTAVTLSVGYGGYTDTVSLTLNERSLAGIKTDPTATPKNRYYEFEPFSYFNVNYLATEEGSVAKFLLYYNNGDEVALAGSQAYIAVDMLQTNLSNFNATDLTADTVVPVTVRYTPIAGTHYETTYNVWLYDRKYVEVNYNSENIYVYSYGVKPVIDYTVKVQNQSEVVTDGVAIKFIGTSETYLPIFTAGDITAYELESTGAQVTHLPVGDYTVNVTYTGRLHTVSAVGLNVFSDSSKIMTVDPTPLEAYFGDDGTLITYDGDYNFDTVYGAAVKNGTYDTAFFRDLFKTRYTLDGGLTYEENILEGNPSALLSISVSIKDLSGVAYTAVLSAGSYTVTLSISDNSLLSNYDVTLLPLYVNVSPKRIFVRFTSNSVDVTYGLSDLTLGEAYYSTFEVDEYGNPTAVAGLEAGDSLTGELLRNQTGFAAEDDSVVRTGNNVGKYPINLGTLENPNYDLIADYALDGYHLNGAYYNIVPAQLTIAIDAKTIDYGDDGRVFATLGARQVGTIDLNSKLFSISGRLYGIYGTGVYENVAAGSIDTTLRTFSIGGTAYTYSGTSVMRNSSTVAGSSISTTTGTIIIGARSYFFMLGTTVIYERLGLIDTTAKTMQVSGVSYYYEDKQDVEWSVTFAGLKFDDTAYNRSITVALSEGRLVDETTGLGISFDLLFGGGTTRPTQFGSYLLSGTNGVIDSYNYIISEITTAAYDITKKEVVVTPTAQSKIYLAQDPEFTYSVSFAEVEDLLAESITGNVDRVAGETVGTYAYTLGTVANANYSFTLESVLFTIDKKTIYLEFTEEGITKQYDGFLPAIDFTDESYKAQYNFYYYVEGVKTNWSKDNVDLTALSVQFAYPETGYGSYAITLVSDEDNHLVTLDRTYIYTITKRIITVTFKTKLSEAADIPSNWTTLSAGLPLTYTYGQSKLLVAEAGNVVAGETITIGVSPSEVSEVGQYTVTALTINGSSNYDFDGVETLSFSIVKKNLYVYVSSANLTQVYGTSGNYISSFSLFESYSGNPLTSTTLEATENAVLSAALSFSVGDGVSQGWVQDGYPVQVTLSAAHAGNYTVVTQSDRVYQPTSFDEDGVYVAGFGGKQSVSISSLRYIVNKQQVTATIAGGYLSKAYNNAAPAVNVISVSPNQISERLLRALVYTRVLAPDGSIVDPENNPYPQSDIGTFRISVNNRALDGTAANYYCVLESTYIYEIRAREVTIYISQGTATDIYRRYNGLPLTHDDVVSVASVDGVTRSIRISNYSPSSVTDTNAIITAAGVRFVFENLNAINAGSYRYYVVSSDYNQTFVLNGADGDRMKTFEIKRQQLDIAISNDMYRYYKGSQYYLGNTAINLSSQYQINTQVFANTPVSNGVNTAPSGGELNVNSTLYYVSGTKLYTRTAEQGVDIVIGGSSITVGHTQYPISNYNSASGILTLFDTTFLVKDGKVYRQVGTIDNAASPTVAELDNYVLITLPKSTFSGLALQTTLGVNSVATAYYGVMQFSGADTFEDDYDNYSLPSLASVKLLIKPAEITVTITSTTEGGTPLDKNYGDAIDDVEKQLLKNGKINYTLPQDVVYSGVIDAANNTIRIYSDEYYFRNGDVFRIVGERTSSAVTIDTAEYRIYDSLLYSVEGNYQSGVFNIGAITYYIDGDIVYNTRFGDGTPGNAYIYAGAVGTYDATLDLIRLNNISTVYTHRDDYIIINASVGSINVAANAILIGSDAYSFVGSKVFATAGTIDTSSYVLNIGGREYIYIGRNIFEVEGSYDSANRILSVDGVNYNIDGGILYTDGVSADGEYIAADKYFSVGSAGYLADAGNRVYAVAGLFDELRPNDYFVLYNTGYYYNNGLLYREHSVGGGYVEAYNGANYSIDTVNSRIVVAGVTYTYSGRYIRRTYGTITVATSSFDINGVDYTYAAGVVYQGINIVVGASINTSSSLITIGNTTYYYLGGYVYEVEGNLNTSTRVFSLRNARYIYVGTEIYLVQGDYNSGGSSAVLGEVAYLINGTNVYKDTEVVLGEFDSALGRAELNGQIYFVNGNVLYLSGSNAGSIDLAGNEFYIGDTKYIFATSAGETIAYDTTLVTFAYYRRDGEVGNYTYVPISMSETTAVGDYFFTVNFGGTVENYVEGVPFSGNYTFVSDYGTISVNKSEIEVLLSGNLEWVYRESFVAEEDFARHNAAQIMTFGSAIEGFSMDGLNYPEFTTAARAYFDALATSDVVGKTYSITASSFTNLNDTNTNYTFRVAGSATITVVKRLLTTTVVAINTGNNTVSRSISKNYGVLPTASELAILYSGFSTTDLEATIGAAVYYQASGAWYVVYNYSQQTTLDIEPASTAQASVLAGLINTNAALPAFYVSTYTENSVNYADLYDAGNNRIAVSETGSGFASANYGITTPANFTFTVLPVPLSLTLKSNASTRVILYGDTLVRGNTASDTSAEYYILISNGVGNRLISTINIGGTNYVVDTADSLFFDQREAGYNWLVYNDAVNMSNTGARKGSPVYLTLGDAQTSKFESLSPNYILTYAQDPIEIQIYNKIESIRVGDGTLYSAVIGADSYVPIRVFYRDGSASEIIPYYLDGRATNPIGVVLGDAGDFVYDSMVSGNQTVKLTYSETNNGVDGNIDTAYVFITLRAFPNASDTAEETNSASGGYKRFNYLAYTAEAAVSINKANLASTDGVIGMDTNGDGAYDAYFLFVEKGGNTFAINDVEYYYTGATVYLASNNSNAGSINVGAATVTIGSVTYYVNATAGNLNIYSTRSGSVGSYTYTGRVGAFSTTKYLYAYNTITDNYQSTDLSAQATDNTTSFTLTNYISFGEIFFNPSSSANAEIVVRGQSSQSKSVVTLASDLTNINAYMSNAVTLDVNGDGGTDYYVLLAKVGTLMQRYVYVYRNGAPATTFARVSVTSQDETDWSISRTAVFVGLDITVNGANITVGYSIKAIDKQYALSVTDTSYAFGTTKTKADGLTYVYSGIAPSGEYDRLKLEFCLQPLYGLEGEFDFVIFSYTGQNGTLYELSIRLLSGGDNRAKLFVVESINGNESITEYNTFTGTFNSTYVDMMDARVHFMDVYLSRLSNSLTIVLDDVMTITHSFIASTGISIGGTDVILDVNFPLEDYAEYYDGDNIFTTDRVNGSAYFTVRNLKFNVSHMAYINMGYINEMAISLIPGDESNSVLYVTAETPLTAIVVAEYFTILGNYSDGTVTKYYLNNILIDNYALRVWLEQGTYRITAKIYFGEVLLDTAYYYLTVKPEETAERVNDSEPSFTLPVEIVSDAAEVVAEGNTTQQYNYYKAEFNLDKDATHTYDGSEYNIIINLKTNNKTESAFNGTGAAYVGLSLGLKFGADGGVTTDLALKAGNETYTLTTDTIDWLQTTDKNFVIEGYMDGKNQKVTVVVYLGESILYTFVMQKDSLIYSTVGAYIETEEAISGYSAKSRNIASFIQSSGGQSILLYKAKLVVYDISLIEETNIRQGMYSIAQGPGAGAPVTTSSTVYNSRITPTSMQATTNQYAIVMLGNGTNQPYAMDYNSYAVDFALERPSSGAATIRFIVAENRALDIRSMYNAYSLPQGNFTATRAIALVYTDDGTTAEMYFTFMINVSSGIYKQTIYSTTDRMDWRVLSYENGGALTRHSISVNMHKAPESLASDLFSSANMTVMYLQVVIDGRICRTSTDGLTGAIANYYFPYYNSVAWWNPSSGIGTTADGVNINDKYFLDQYTMAGVVFNNCTFKLYNMTVAKCDSLAVSEEFILSEVKGGNEAADNFYYYEYFSELFALGGMFTEDEN